LYIFSFLFENTYVLFILPFLSSLIIRLFSFLFQHIHFFIYPSIPSISSTSFSSFIFLSISAYSIFFVLPFLPLFHLVGTYFSFSFSILMFLYILPFISSFIVCAPFTASVSVEMSSFHSSELHRVHQQMDRVKAM
jgi:hypothetical protein